MNFTSISFGQLLSGVDPDDDARTIKLAYRKMALKFRE